MRPRYLSKSRFALALECPTKLYYTRKKDYVDQKLEDAFLEALAEGGFQVGELAKHYYPNGHDIEALDTQEALEQTNQLLKQDDVIIYEAAVNYQDFFVRVDILEKKGNRINLIEVKSKSFDGTSEEDFLGRHGISYSWRPYLYDVAFQKHVLTRAFPDWEISAYLMLTDTNARCPTDGLNQKFKLFKDHRGRKSVKLTAPLTPQDLSTKLLRAVSVDSCCDILFSQPFGDTPFDEYLQQLAQAYKDDCKIEPVLTSVCGHCQFRASQEERGQGLKSGFHECWQQVLDWTEADFQQQTVLDLWNYRKKNDLIADGRIKLSELDESDVSPTEDSSPGLSPTQRQWLQVEKVKTQDESYWIDKENLAAEMGSWVFPLHFIDFETSMVAIPFNKGRHPYEGIAFQFSHHVVHSDGRVEHKSEYINTQPGFFPNYEFARELKTQLSQDKGSIFRYAAHENTYLNMIYNQLKDDPNPVPDRDELCEFIRSISTSPANSPDPWQGERTMIDMLELVKRYYYDPSMKGSNSIKQVLPAILNNSSFVQDKYSQPIYGAKNGISSLNFTDWAWIKHENGRVKDPYKLLPGIFEDLSPQQQQQFDDYAEDIREGGAAMVAYARLQFEDVPQEVRQAIIRALLKYCELDTLAMVMIYEGWRDLIL